MTLGEKIKLLRKEKGWNQPELAERLGIEKQRISKYEANINRPVLDVLVKLAKIFDVSIDYLIFDETDEIKFNDKELIQYFKIVDKFPLERKKIIKDLLKELAVLSHKNL